MGVTEEKTQKSVALFVDFDHLRHAGVHSQRVSSPSASALEAILQRAQELGRVVTANVYAEWETIPGMQAEVKRLHLDPRFVFSGSRQTDFSMARGCATAVTLSLDALQSLYERPDIDTYMIVSGEDGMLDLLGRLKSHRKAVYLIGFDSTVHPDLRASADSFEPLESFLQLDEIKLPDTPPSPEAYETPFGKTFDWKPFVLLLNRLEGNLPFVSLKYLKNQVLTPAHGCENTQESKAALIREAIRMHFIDTSKVPNPRNPSFATTACRLNRNHPDVRRVLGG